MAQLPKKPQRGDKVLQSIYDSVCDIIDYLPSLNLVGDNKTTSVNHSMYGTTIHAIQPKITAQGEKSIYEAGSGLSLTGNVFNVEIDPNTMAIVNNRLSCTIEAGSSGEGTDHKYADNGCKSLLIAPPEDQVNGWNYIGVNPDWIAGNGMCSEGYYAVMSAILKAFSGTNLSTPFAIGSQSIQTMGTEIWVNPYWLAGYTSCSAGFYGICSAVYRYLNALPVTDNGDTLKKGGQMGFYWGVDATGGGPGGDTNTLYKYEDQTGSLYFSSNDPSPADNVTANNVCVNVSWLAGLTDCKAGAEAVQYAVASGLAALTHDATSCTLKIDNETSALYWAPDNTANIVPSTGLTSTAILDENEETVGIAISISAVNEDKVLSCHNGVVSWETNTATSPSPPPPGDGDHVFKYDCADASIYFVSNDAEEYATPDSSIDANYIGVNADWLAGNGVCKVGFEGVCSAVYKYLTGLSTYDATSCTLKINPTTSALYWAEDIGANQNFLISTGLTSAVVTDSDTGTTIGTSVALNSTYRSDLNVITGHSNSSNYNKVLSCNSYGAIGWVTNDAGGGGGYDGNDWYKYKAMNDSLIFYPSNSTNNGTTEVSFNPNWLAGNGDGCCCYEGPAAVASAIIKILTDPQFDAAAETIISALKTNSHWNSY